MIHHWLMHIKLFDALFLGALATAAYIHMGYTWLIYVITMMTGVALFRTFKDVSSWFQFLGDQINFLARCIRDHD